MMRLLITILVSLLFAAAWGEVTNSVPAANLFGSVKIEGSMDNAFVAVPFTDFDGSSRKVTEVVSTVGLSNGDKLYVWDNAADKYDVFTIADGVWTAASKVTVSADGTASSDNPDPSRLVSAGTGVILQRTSKDTPIYLYGQIPAAPAKQTLPAGLSLLSVPGTNTLAAVDLNAFPWTGVTASTSSARAGTGTRRGLLKVAGDSIYFRNAENVVMKMHYFDGKWGYFMGGYWTPEAKIPAGTAFWYYNKGSASVTW